MIRHPLPMSGTGRSKTWAGSSVRWRFLSYRSAAATRPRGRPVLTMLVLYKKLVSEQTKNSRSRSIRHDLDLDISTLLLLRRRVVVGGVGILKVGMIPS